MATGMIGIHGVITALLVAVTFGEAALFPRVGLFAIPFTVAWGSVVPIPNGRVTDVVVAGLVTSWLVRAAYTRRFDIDMNPWLLATAGLLLIMLLSVTQAVSISTSMRELIKWSEVFAIAALAPVFLRKSQDIWIAMYAMIAAGVTEAILGIAQFAFHIGPHNFQIYGHFMRAYGTFGQPNPMAGFLEIALMIAVAAAWAGRKSWCWPASAVIATGAAVTFSRAGWAGAAIGLILVACLISPRFRPLLFLAGSGALAVALLAAFALVPTAPFVHAASSFGITGVDFRHHTKADFSEIERAAHWVAGLRMFIAHPLLGVGIGNYSNVYGAYFVPGFSHALGHAHDYFINIAAETGIFGLFAYVLFLLTGMWMSITAGIRATPRSIASTLGIGMAGAWACVGFHNVFDVLFVHEIATLIGLLMGALWIAIRLDDSNLARESRPPSANVLAANS